MVQLWYLGTKNVTKEHKSYFFNPINVAQLVIHVEFVGGYIELKTFFIKYKN